MPGSLFPPYPVLRAVYGFVVASSFVASLSLPLVGEAAVGIQRLNNGCQFPTVTDAVAASRPGDTLLIAPGTYLENDIRTFHSLVFTQSDPGCLTESSGQQVVIDGGGGPRVLTLRAMPNPAVVQIHNLTITNGSDAAGGVLRAIGDVQLTISNSVLSNGVATVSGGCLVIETYDTAVLNSTTVENCVSSDTGGGITVWTGGLDLRGATVVRNNTARTGGGILTDVDLVMTDTAQVSDNTAFNDGGGVRAYGSLRMYSDATIRHNSANLGGGVAIPPFGEATLRGDSNIAYNNATHGGGVYMNGDTTRAADGVRPARLTLYHSASIYSNDATINGGGVNMTGNDNTVRLNEGTSIRFNDAASGGGIWSGLGSLPAVLTVNQVIATSATIEKNGATARGGGAFFDVGKHVFTDSKVINNRATSDAAGMLIGAEASVTMTTDINADIGGCHPSTLPADRYCSGVSGNISGRHGGGVFAYGAFLADHTAFQLNRADKGSAMYIALSGYAEVDDGLVAENTDHVTSAGAIQVRGAANIDHFTVTENSAKGVRTWGGSTLFERSISYGNGLADWHADGAFGNAAPCSTLGQIQGTAPQGLWITTNPDFVTTARGRWRLGPNSGAIDQCSVSSTRDLDKNSRPSGNASDMGAFER